MANKFTLKELFALLEKCPVKGDNPKDCPLHNHRRKDDNKKKSWIEELSFNELDGIYSYHTKCYAKKMKNC
jgi:hypothetical protein